MVGTRPTQYTRTKSSQRAQLIAIIDDDRSVLRALKDLLESAGLSAQCFASAEEFLGTDPRTRAACVVADIRMPGMSGLELQARLKAEGSPIPIIFITAHDDPKLKVQAMSAGAVAFLAKPFDHHVLLEQVRASIAA